MLSDKLNLMKQNYLIKAIQNNSYKTCTMNMLMKEQKCLNKILIQK